MKDRLADVTGIHGSILDGSAPLTKFCIAQKLSWAANRQLTRPEDTAYCLVGIFDISLDIRYGEGRARAFLRLQQEIVRNSGDASIFAWNHTSLMNRQLGDKHPGLLAPSPEYFAGCGTVARAPKSDYESQFFRFENGAIATRLRMRPVAEEVYQAIFEGFKISDCRSAIYLEKLKDGDQYRRVKWDGKSQLLLSEDGFKKALHSWRQYQLVRVSVPQKTPSPSRNLDFPQVIQDSVAKSRFKKLRFVSFVAATTRMVMWKLGL